MSNHDEKAPELLQNENGIDRAVRAAIGVALVAISLLGVVPAPYDAWLRLVSILPFATAMLGWCPLYQLLSVSTLRASVAGRAG